ncbi:MAG: sulfatase-like hydrolase/transferase [Rikenellaceae bacterium]
MNNIKLTLPLLAVATIGTSAVSATANNRPNIIFILSDDGGYADWGFQGSKQFKTPNLDAMAKEGVILEQVYTTDAVSGPSRAGLMTGRYQQKFGIEENNVPGLMSESSKLIDADMGVPLDQKFISDYLGEAGYKCAVFGKWHLGATDPYHPFERGYDHFVGFRSGARSFYAYKESEFESNIIEEKKLEYGFRNFVEPDRYLTDILADAACEYVVENKENPFFIYLAFNAVHSPLEVDPKDMEQFSHIEDPRRQKLAAMAYSMDRGCGKLWETLKREGLDKNTIIVFSNDNGGPDGTNTSNYPLSGAKATFLEGGIRVPGFVLYPDIIEGNTRYPYPVSFMDFLPTFTNLAGVDTAEADLDGVDLLPYLTGKNEERPHQTLYWKCENRGVVRDGDMKFMRYPDRPAELYDISKDQGEHNNLATQYPELIKKYYKMLFEWELTLERPLWLLDRFCEGRVMNQIHEQEAYRYPVEQE